MRTYLTLYICRHGETTDNVGEIWTGQLPGELNEMGKSFAQTELAQLINWIKPKAIYSSDLQRAEDTKNLAVQAAKYNGKIFSDKRLREANFGLFQGKKLIDIENLISENNIEGFNHLSYGDLRYMLNDSRTPLVKQFGAESIENIKKRVYEFSEDLKKTQERNIMLIGHGIINAYLIEYELHQSFGKNFEFDSKIFYPQGHDQVTILKFNINGNLLRTPEVNIPIVEVLNRKQIEYFNASYADLPLKFQ